MSVNLEACWNDFTNGVYKAGSAVVTNTGHLFNVAAAVKDDVSCLEKALRVGRYGFTLARECGTMDDSNLAAVSVSKNFNKSGAIIDVTRLFSDAYYFLSGNFVDDLNNWNLGAALSSISFTVADSIDTYLSFDGMIRLAQGMDSLAEENAELLEKISTGFVIGGYAGQIVENIRTLVYTAGTDVNAWLDLVAVVAGIAIPILAISGVVCVPAFLALAALSTAFTCVSVIYDLYKTEKKKNSGPSLNFADNSAGLGTVLAPIASTAVLLQGCEGIEVMDELLGNMGALKDLSSALGIFSRGFEWFHKRFWERGSLWEIGSKCFATVQSVMDLAAWLNSVNIIEGALKKNNLFKGIKSLISLGAAGCSIIDSGIKLHKLMPKLEARAFKKHKWELLSRTLNVGGQGSAPTFPGVEEWNRLRSDLIQYYDFKIQAELAINAHQPSVSKINLWTSLRDDIARGSTTDYFTTKKNILLAKLGNRIAHINGGLGDQILQAQFADLQISNPAKVVGYRKALADWKFRKEDIDKVNISCKIGADVLKVTSSIASIAAIFFGDMMGKLTSVIDLLSALMGGGKYFTEATYTVGDEPAMNFAAVAA